MTLLCLLVETQRIYKLSHCCSQKLNDLASLMSLLRSFQKTRAVDTRSKIKRQTHRGILSNLRATAVGSNKLRFLAHLSAFHLDINSNSTTK